MGLFASLLLVFFVIFIFIKISKDSFDDDISLGNLEGGDLLTPSAKAYSVRRKLIAS